MRRPLLIAIASGRILGAGGARHHSCQVRHPGRQLDPQRAREARKTPRHDRRARSRRRPLHARVEQGRAGQGPVQLGTHRPGPARPADTWHPAGRHPHRDSGLGERRPRTQIRAPERQGLRRVRRHRGQALPLCALLADLERAEPPPLARADGARHVRPATAQSRLQGHPRREPARARRRRCHRPSRERRRRLAARVASGHEESRRPPRRLRAPSAPRQRLRDSHRGRLLRRALQDGHAREPARARGRGTEGLGLPQADLADRVGLPDRTRPTSSSASRPGCRRSTSARRPGSSTGRARSTC